MGDPRMDYCGIGGSSPKVVCVIVADRVIESARLTYNVCIPGRLLHVRCSHRDVTLDIVAGYQWVWQAAKSDQIAQQRVHASVASVRAMLPDDGYVDISIARPKARQELEMVFSGRSAEDKPSEKEKDTEDAREKEDGSKRHWSEQHQSKEGSTVEDPQTQELLRCLVKMSVRHEQELMRIRPDVGFIAFCDTSDLGCMGMLREVALSWSDLYSQGKVNTALKTMLVMSTMKDMRDRAEKVLRDEEQMQRCFTVGWLKEKKQEVASTPPLQHSDVMKLLDVLLILEHLPRDGVVTRFNTTKRLDLMKEFKTEVVPMMLQLSLRGASAQLCYDAMKALSGNAVMKLQGVRWRPERAQKPPLAKALEDAYLATSFCDWAPRDQSWALLWLMELTGTAVGRLKAEAWDGIWQARLSNPDRCTDEGDQLAVPVFAETTGLSTLHESFQVAVIIYHLGRHLHMPVSLCLPEHMQVVANEELALLQKLRSLTPHHRQHPSLTLLTRNEIFRMARELLDGESWRSFCEFAFQLSQSSGHDGIIAFPLPCLRAVDAVTEAEALAESFLQEGSGFLWSAVREVVRCLPFEDDGREVADGRVFRLGLYCKGGFMGDSKTSWSYVAVGRLINAAVLTTFRGHHWTSLSINKDNRTSPHQDRNNAPGQSLLLGLTHHQNDEIWIEDRCGSKVLRAGAATLRGSLYRTDARAVLFDGRNMLHSTMPWRDCRCIIVAYTVGPFQNMTADQRAHLEDAGFVPPEVMASRRFASSTPGGGEELSDSVRPTGGSCNERQGFVYVSGGAAGSEEGNGSLHQDSQGVSTAVGAGGTPWCTGTSTAADAESPDPDHGRPGSSTDAGASQTGEMVLGMGMGMGTHTIFILDSDEEADIARAIAASLEGPTVDASMNDFSLEEMD
ncbi:unnamed protein product [Symbiodinium sp. KB8]|nr:unnamed protein product [Symbiodinium sp. KB8]